jgi:hypothetical protein
VEKLKAIIEERVTAKGEIIEVSVRLTDILNGEEQKMINVLLGDIRRRKDFIIVSPSDYVDRTMIPLEDGSYVRITKVEFK